MAVGFTLHNHGIVKLQNLGYSRPGPNFTNKEMVLTV